MTDRIERDIDHAIRKQTRSQAVTTTFESDTSPPSGLMRVIESEDYKAEVRFLRYPDTNNPMDNPWHVKVIGPDPQGGGAVRPVWSGSFQRKKPATEAARRNVKKQQRRYGTESARYDGGARAQVTEGRFGPGDHVGYAVFDVSTGGFVRADDMFGGVIFEDIDTAKEVADPGQFILDLEVETLG